MTTTALTLHRRMLCTHLPAPASGRTRNVCAALVIVGLLAIRCLLDDASAAPSTNDAFSTIVIYSILVDGRPRQIPAGMQLLSDSPKQPASVGKVETGKLRVPSLAQRTEFRFGPNPASSNPPVRLRYKLEGFDKEWREAGGEMRLNVRFLDAADSTVSAQDFSVRGESVGWTGTVSQSRFDRRREVVRVPERAVRMQLELFSGGSEQTVGIMVIDDLTVSVDAGLSGKPETLLFNSRLAEPKDSDLPLSAPPGWMRDGSKPSIALLLNSDDYQPRQVLAVVDTDSNTWGAWRTTPDASVVVHPRDTLILQWKEMYSIGWGGAGECGYDYLPPGEYQFRLQALTETGEWTGAMVSLPITVVPPFWQSTWFRSGVLVLIVGTLVAGVRYATGRKMKMQFELLDRQRALELERTRIARDIHDDLGANLTQIALLSELAQTDLEEPALARSHLKGIFTTAGAVARQLDEIVWAITPTNDTLEQFASYVCKYAQDNLRLAGIRCRLEVPEPVPDYSMSSAERHDLFLAAKEALHNVVKHAHADQVWLRLKVEGGALVLVIEDNGRGIDKRSVSATAGHGLANMRNRLKYVGGIFEQKSEIGLGTSVRLVLPLSQR
jgi:signal transduction histidine kinase